MNREGKTWPGYILGGRMRTSTLLLIIAFLAIGWLYETYEPKPDAPTQVPATEVVPPGFIPDPAYTWAPRTDVQRHTPTPTTSTEVTETTTEPSSTDETPTPSSTPGGSPTSSAPAVTTTPGSTTTSPSVAPTTTPAAPPSTPLTHPSVPPSAALTPAP